MGRRLNGHVLLRKSNRSLYREACNRPGAGRRSGPTPFQARTAQANRIDDLFMEGCLIEEDLDSPPYARRTLARQLSTGRVLRMSVFAKEMSLDTEGYRAVAKQVLTISHPDVVQPTKILDVAARLVVLRPYITGESLTQLINRVGPLPADAAVTFSILLLNLLAKLDSNRITWIHASQLILVAEDRMLLVDLDETEALFFKRQVRLKSTNGVLLTGKDRKFIAPEVLQATGYNSQRALIYSVGQILSYLLWPNGVPHDRNLAEKCHVSESIRRVVEQLTAPDPTDRPATYAESVRNLQLANQAAVAPSITYPVPPLLHDLSDRPVVRTLSLTKCTLLLGVLTLTIVSIGYFSRSLSTLGSIAGESTKEGDTPRVIQSDEAFQIP